MSLAWKIGVEGALSTLLFSRMQRVPKPFKAYAVVLEALYGDMLRTNTCPACGKQVRNIVAHFKSSKKCKSLLVHCTILVAEELISKHIIVMKHHYKCGVCRKTLDHLWQALDHIIREHPEVLKEVASSTMCLG